MADPLFTSPMSGLVGFTRLLFHSHEVVVEDPSPRGRPGCARHVRRLAVLGVMVFRSLVRAAPAVRSIGRRRLGFRSWDMDLQHAILVARPDVLPAAAERQSDLSA